MTEEKPLGDRNLPMCPICGHGTFDQERGKIDSQWGMTAHRVTLLICQRCSYVLTFYDGNTIFDFD
jgi:ribosomal protein S27AE